MIKRSIFNFIIEKDARTITVERSFNAPVDPIWAAWTQPEILCKWWAPRPYQCVITSLDFRPGGRWSYYMQGPTGDRHFCFFDYEAVKVRSSFSGSEGFCDEKGMVNSGMPVMRWNCAFNATDHGTLVRVVISFDSTEDLEKITQMGFKEGFTMGLDQLDELLTSRSA